MEGRSKLHLLGLAIEVQRSFVIAGFITNIFQVLLVRVPITKFKHEHHGTLRNRRRVSNSISWGPVIKVQWSSCQLQVV